MNLKHNDMKKKQKKKNDRVILPIATTQLSFIAANLNKRLLSFIIISIFKMNFTEYSMLLGEKTSGNLQACRRGRLDITI